MCMPTRVVMLCPAPNSEAPRVPMCKAQVHPSSIQLVEGVRRRPKKSHCSPMQAHSHAIGDGGAARHHCGHGAALDSHGHCAGCRPQARASRAMAERWRWPRAAAAPGVAAEDNWHWLLESHLCDHHTHAPPHNAHAQGRLRRDAHRNIQISSTYFRVCMYL